MLALEKESQYTALSIMNDFQTVFNHALEEKDFTNANKAKEHQGRHIGMFTDKLTIKAEVTGTHLHKDVGEMSLDELEEEHRRLTGNE